LQADRTLAARFNLATEVFSSAFEQNFQPNFAGLLGCFQDVRKARVAAITLYHGLSEFSNRSLQILETVGPSPQPCFNPLRHTPRAPSPPSAEAARVEPEIEMMTATSRAPASIVDSGQWHTDLIWK
jgi:hypothetical protein